MAAPEAWGQTAAASLPWSGEANEAAAGAASGPRVQAVAGASEAAGTGVGGQAAKIGLPGEAAPPAVGTGSRDGDRQRVYDAEDAAFLETSYAERLGERGCRWVLDHLVVLPWWSTAAPGPPPVLRAARSDSARSTMVVAGDRVEVRIGPGMDQAHVLSHELAHLVAPAGAGHGAAFRAAHLDVATLLLGAHGSARLADFYGRAGLAVAARAWPPPPEHGPGGLLAVWQARVALEAVRHR